MKSKIFNIIQSESLKREMVTRKAQWEGRSEEVSITQSKLQSGNRKKAYSSDKHEFISIAWVGNNDALDT